MSRLRVDALTKVYPTVVANEDVSLDVQAGEIHAILGENGAGKSTLMKMIYGVTEPTRGEIYWEDKKVEIRSPAQARALGIGMVFQHFSLFETLTVAQNTALFLPAGQSMAALSEKIREVSEHYGLPVDPESYIHDLSVGERQRVEIIRCLIQNPKLLIMDEPTSVLSPIAVEKLFETLKTIRSEGCAILYISHKLDEIMSLCDRATVLRGGRVTGQCVPSEETEQSLARLMIGRDFDPPVRDVALTGRTVLSVQGLSYRPPAGLGTALTDINLSVRAGEILGVAGISGNGQKAFCDVLAGLVQVSSDMILLDGKAAGNLDAEQRRQLGLAYVPEDRLGVGALPDMTLSENAVLTAAKRQSLVDRGLIRFQQARNFAQSAIDRFRVRASGPDALARSLSGGNLQKFVVGREMLQNPKILICAQPTWGVDVGAAAFIRQSLIDLAREGCAILVVSEELDEIYEVSDRVAVMAKGRLSPIKPIQETSTEEIGLWMSGLWTDNTDNTQSRDQVINA